MTMTQLFIILAGVILCGLVVAASAILIVGICAKYIGNSNGL